MDIIEEQLKKYQGLYSSFVIYSIETLHSKMESGNICFFNVPSQTVWDNSMKSRFIESIILGLSTPSFFFLEDTKGDLSIIDGYQRLITISEFLKNELKLTDLRVLTSLSGLCFGSLPKHRQIKIKTRPIGSVVIKNFDFDNSFDLSNIF